MTQGFDQREAPNFGKTNYPGNGERIGPAWKAAWSTLDDGAWHGRDELIDIMRQQVRWATHMDITDVTALNLLRQARRHGILETRKNFRPDGGNASNDYRRPA